MPAAHSSTQYLHALLFRPPVGTATQSAKLLDATPYAAHKHSKVPVVPLSLFSHSALTPVQPWTHFSVASVTEGLGRVQCDRVVDMHACCLKRVLGLCTDCP
jgi:hypothetical protein